MADFSLDNQYPINYFGVFDYQGLYELCMGYWEDKGFFLHHIKYVDKPDAPGTREREFELMATNDFNDYVRWNVTISVVVINGGDVAVQMAEGQKTMTRGKLMVRLGGELEFDYLKNFKTPFEKKMKKYIQNHTKKAELGKEHKGALVYTLADFNQKIKEFLHFDTQKGEIKPINL